MSVKLFDLTRAHADLQRELKKAEARMDDDAADEYRELLHEATQLIRCGGGEASEELMYYAG